MSVNNGGSGGTAAARELAGGLRALRTEAQLTTRALGEAINASSANVSYWERGERLIPEDRLLAVLEALQVAEDERERLIGLRHQADGPGQLVAGTPTVGALLGKLVEYEQVARTITDCSPLVIPGLLQTSDYARAILGNHPDVDARVALRVGRRDILTRRNPAELIAIIDSEVLVRPIAPPDVMVDQLHHLIEMGRRPNITIQVRQATKPGYSPLLTSPWILMEFSSAAPIVHQEHLRASTFLWAPEDVREYLTAAEQVKNEAMTPARSAEVIAEIANGMETTT